MKFKDSFHPYALITIIFWALAYVLTRLTLQYFSAFSLGFLRYFVASAALLIVAVLTKMKLPRAKDILWFVASGGVGFFLYMITFNQGQSYVTAATGSVVMATVPVITSFFALIIYGEKLKGFQWAAFVVEFIGVIVLTMMNSSFSVNKGLIWLFLAAIALSVYNLFQRKLTKSYSAIQASSFSIFFGTIMLAVFAPSSLHEAAHAPAIQFLYIALLGVCSSAVAYIAWAKAFSKAKQTSQVTNYMFITPFITTLLGFIIAGEVPDSATLIGGGIILIGVMIFNFGGSFLNLCKKR